MTDAATPSQPARQRHSRFLRFSLRTLLVFALLAGAVGLLIRNWAPWVPEVSLARAVVSRDGTHALGRGDGVLAEVWDLARGRKMCSIPVDWSRGAAYSPDKTRALVFLSDGRSEVWDVDRGTKVCALDLERFPAERVFSHDWKLLAAGDGEGAWHVTDLETGKVLSELRGIKSVVQFSFDRSRILAWNYYKQCGLFGAGTGKLLFYLELEKPIEQVYFTRGGQLAVLSAPCYFGLVDANTGAQRLWLKSDYLQPAISKDERFAAVLQGVDVNLCVLETGETNTIEGCAGIAQILRGGPFFTSDGKLVVELEKSVLLIDPEMRKVAVELDRSEKHFDERYRQQVGRESTPDARWEAAERKQRLSMRTGETLELPGGRTVTADDGKFKVIEAKTKTLLAEFGEDESAEEPVAGSKRSRTRHSGRVPRAYRSDVSYAYSIPDAGKRVCMVKDQSTVKLYVNRRPERWWGVAWIPEGWAVGGLLVLFAWSLIRDWRVKT